MGGSSSPPSQLERLSEVPTGLAAVPLPACDQNPFAKPSPDNCLGSDCLSPQREPATVAATDSKCMHLLSLDHHVQQTQIAPRVPPSTAERACLRDTLHVIKKA